MIICYICHEGTDTDFRICPKCFSFYYLYDASREKRHFIVWCSTHGYHPLFKKDIDTLFPGKFVEWQKHNLVILIPQILECPKDIHALSRTSCVVAFMD